MMRPFLILLILVIAAILQSCSDESFTLTAVADKNTIHGNDTASITVKVSRSTPVNYPLNVDAFSNVCGRIIKITPDYSPDSTYVFRFIGGDVSSPCTASVTAKLTLDSNILSTVQLTVLPPLAGGYVQTGDSLRPDVVITPDVKNTGGRWTWTYEVVLSSYQYPDYMKGIDVYLNEPAQDIRIINSSFSAPIDVTSADKMNWKIVPRIETSGLKKITFELISQNKPGGKIRFRVFDKNDKQTDDIFAVGPTK
ncbi:hypothetical protein BH10BAC5_BH10BAC5_05790 [soil metagenome]